MALQLVCSCGNPLRVPEAHAGRRVKCPRCGASQLVTAQPQAPARPLPPGRKSPSSRPLVALALLLPLLLAAVAAGWWFFRKDGTPADDDLALIPGDASAFVSARLGALWKTPLVQQLLDEEKKRGPDEFLQLGNRIEQLTGLQPAQVQRVSLVLADAERQLGWAVVQTAAPYRREALLSRLSTSREGLYRGHPYIIGNHQQTGGEVAVTFLSPTVFVTGTEEGVKACLGHRRSWSRGARGPLSPVLALCARRYHVVAGFHPTPALRQRLAGSEALAVLAEMRLAQLTIDVDDEAMLEARAQAADEAQAKQLLEQANGLLTLARGYLFVTGLKGGEQGKAAQQMGQLLGQLKLEQQGAELTARMKTDAATLSGAVGAVGALPNLLPGR